MHKEKYPELLDDNVNHGVIEERLPFDWAEGDLDYEIVVPNGDHRPWLPTGEPQSAYVNGVRIERYNCVTQAIHNVKETIMMRDIALGRMPKDKEQWLRDNGFFDDNGKINFSERYNSVQNGTKWNDPNGNNGNSLSNVSNWDRAVGLIPARMLPDIPTMPNAEYYNPSVVTPAMRAMGEEFKKRFGQPTGWITANRTDVVNHLKQAPLCVTKPGHAIEGADDKEGTAYLTIFDSYNPFLKDLAYTRLVSAMKVLVKYLPYEPLAGWKRPNDATVYIRVGSTFLVPVADWGAFTALGGSNSTIKELTPEVSSQLTVMRSVLFKTSN